MLATFYLTGIYSATTLADTFTITGEPGGIVHSGIEKWRLLTGHPINFVDSVTGGTVTATDATCEGTSVPWYVIQATPTPTPTPTAGSGFYRSTLTGTYPVTSPGTAQLRIYNYTSDPKYIYLVGNSTYISSGTLAGNATMDPGGANETATSINATITSTNQLEYGTNNSYLYIPAMTYYNFNIVHTSPSAGSFYFEYTDTTHPTKTAIPILVS